MVVEREENTEEDGEREMMEDNMLLLYLANGGDVVAIEALLDSRTDVNSTDFDRRTTIHVAACEGRKNVLALLLNRGVNVNSQDRWGNTPLADSIHYKNYDVCNILEDVCKLLEENGAMLSMAPMHVTNERDIQDYEIDPDELDFRNSVQITKGTYQIALWGGIRVVVKIFGEDILIDSERLSPFRDELLCCRECDIQMLFSF